MKAKRDFILRGSCFCGKYGNNRNILLTKTTAARNEVALTYHKVRGLHFLAVVFVATIVIATYQICSAIKNIIGQRNINTAANLLSEEL